MNKLLPSPSLERKIVGSQNSLLLSTTVFLILNIKDCFHDKKKSEGNGLQNLIVYFIFINLLFIQVSWGWGVERAGNSEIKRRDRQELPM